jgi:hypothetical protein
MILLPILALLVIMWFALRSAKKWQMPPPSSPETKDAEAGLWSKKGFGSHGGR